MTTTGVKGLIGWLVTYWPSCFYFINEQQSSDMTIDNGHYEQSAKKRAVWVTVRVGDQQQQGIVVASVIISLLNQALICWPQEEGIPFGWKERTLRVGTGTATTTTRECRLGSIFLHFRDKAGVDVTSWLPTLSVPGLSLCFSIDTSTSLARPFSVFERQIDECLTHLRGQGAWVILFRRLKCRLPLGRIFFSPSPSGRHWI